MNALKPLNPFQNVAASGTAICDLYPVCAGFTIEGIWLTLGGGSFTKAMITAWRLKINGKVVRESTGTNTDTRNKFFGITTAATQLLIDFMYRKARTPLSFGAAALDVSAASGIRQLTLEVDISGATTPTLAAHVELSPAGNIKGEEKVRFAMLKTTRATVNVPAAGEYAIDVPHIRPEAGGSVYANIQLFSANTTALRVRRQAIDEWTASKTLLEELQKANGRTPQANLVVFDPTLDNILPGRVWDTTSRSPADPIRPGAGVTNAQLLVTASGSETFVCETEEVIYLNDY